VLLADCYPIVQKPSNVSALIRERLGFFRTAQEK
jgi:hypothetical protein